MSYVLSTLAEIEVPKILDNTEYSKHLFKNFYPGSTQYVDDDVKKRLRPAIKHPTTGKLYIGKRGDTHDDLMMKHLSRDDYEKYEDNHDYKDNHTGFHDRKTGDFYTSRYTAVDSTDLMTIRQKGLRFGDWG